MQGAQAQQTAAKEQQGALLGYRCSPDHHFAEGEINCRRHGDGRNRQIGDEAEEGDAGRTINSLSQGAAVVQQQGHVA